MAESRDLMTTYRDLLRDLRKQAGIAGPLLAPLQMQADLIEQALSRQGEFERRVTGLLEPMGALMELARDAPATLRTQAKAFETASVSFRQAAEVMNLQADLLERAGAALERPAGLLRGFRPGGDIAKGDEDDDVA
jgi:hypothetical protein